ncbi:hypothetical protein ATCC90586_000801 [Pythium insidiosum]|nr:hypothetical protein ATCC90586_000801 [Pythium insidiosum]
MRAECSDDGSDEELAPAGGPVLDSSEPALQCTCDSVKLMVTLLSCLFPGKKDQRVRCDVDNVGMLFTAHSRGKSLQIKTSLGAELFDSYVLRQPEEADSGMDGLETQYSFALNLNALIESLSMFGPSALATSSLRLSYFPQTATLTLVVEDNGVICECAMQVLELEGNDVGQLEFESAFEQSAVLGRCIIQSEPLQDAFAELYDLPSAACVTISMFPDINQFNSDNRPRSALSAQECCLSLSATSETGSCEIEFARSSSAFIEFFCASSDDNDGECAATFHVAVLQQAFKALAHSNETFLRMNGDGFLSVQHMIETGTGERAFVDALVSPEDTSIP